MNKERITRYKEKEEHFNRIFEKLKKWILDISVNEFLTKTNLEKQFAIYHAYQIIIEIITDLAAMAVKDLKILPKDDYVNINILAENNIISETLATKMKDANGLRNRIVHNYNGLADEIAYKSILSTINDIEKYIEAIKNWIKRNS